MKKKTILGTILSISLALIIAVATIVPALAVPDQAQTNTVLKNYGIGGGVFLNLPTPSNASPPAPPGTPSHPTDMQLRVADFNSRSYSGAHDSIFVYLWIPQRNSYNLVAIITDQANTELDKKIWNNTFAWTNTTGNPDANLVNIIQVNDQDLEIWAQKAREWGWYQDDNGRSIWGVASSSVLTVNLTKPVRITLPFNLFPAPFTAYGNLTFNLAPMLLTFRETGDSYFDGGALFILSSGYKYLPVAGMRTPAWVEERIPTWIGGASPLEVSGHIDYEYVQTFTPP